MPNVSGDEGRCSRRYLPDVNGDVGKQQQYSSLVLTAFEEEDSREYLPDVSGEEKNGSRDICQMLMGMKEGGNRIKQLFPIKVEEEIVMVNTEEKKKKEQFKWKNAKKIHSQFSQFKYEQDRGYDCSIRGCFDNFNYQFGKMCSK